MAQIFDETNARSAPAEARAAAAKKYVDELSSMFAPAGWQLSYVKSSIDDTSNIPTSDGKYDHHFLNSRRPSHLAGQTLGPNAKQNVKLVPI
jgi:hypothetical protein